MVYTFRRPSEADAYRICHEQGFRALEDVYGPAVASDLINRWAEAGIARITYPDGWMTVRTFKKYVAVTARA